MMEFVMDGYIENSEPTKNEVILVSSDTVFFQDMVPQAVMQNEGFNYYKKRRCRIVLRMSPHGDSAKYDC